MNTFNTFGSLRGLLATAIFGALVLSFCAVSIADAGTEAVSMTVKFAGLNISKPAGAAVLYTRINAAAENLCSYYWFKSDADQNQCVHNAIANAVMKTNEPALFAVYNEKNKTSLPTALVAQSH